MRCGPRMTVWIAAVMTATISSFMAAVSVFDEVGLAVALMLFDRQKHVAFLHGVA